MRCVVLAFLVSCGPPAALPDTRWESAPPPPPKPPPTTLAMRPADAAKPSPYANEPPSRPLGEPCPEDLSLTVARTIDGRKPSASIKARYAKQHQQLVRRDELIAPGDAITRVLEIERKQPGVVPAGFRGMIGHRGRDPKFRLHMARCELSESTTVRRAGYDAALAFLLGAPRADVMPLMLTSMYPEGTMTRPCDEGRCRKDTCDAVTQQCVSAGARLAAYLSATELEIEDILVRGFGTYMTTPRLERDRYDPDDLISSWMYGRYVKCDGVLCQIRRADVKGKTRLIYWDRRYQGERGGSRKPMPHEICYAETGSTTRDLCIAHCEGDRGSPQRATCVGACTALCPIEPDNSPGSDDD